MSESAVPSAAPRLRVAVLLLAALAAAGGAAPVLASLREAPPKGVDLSGSWELDPVRSDDPEIVRAQLREAMRQQMEKMRRQRRHGGWGGGGGDDDRNGDGTDTEGGGRGSPGGGGGGGGRHRSPGGGGGGGGGAAGGSGGGSGAGPGASASEDAPAEAGERGGGPGGGAGPGRNPNFAALANPARVPFEQQPGTVHTALGDGPFDCEPGETVSVTDMQGMAERHCGWNGSAFIVTLDRKRGVSREDRFELSRDRRLLLYSTTLSGGKLPKVTVKRTYVRSEGGH
jgi:hypothetical protein